MYGASAAAHHILTPHTKTTPHDTKHSHFAPIPPAYLHPYPHHSRPHSLRVTSSPLSPRCSSFTL